MKLGLGGFPIEYSVKYEKEENIIYLPSFCTNPRGYRMCVQFYPNGFQVAKSTHVSLFVCIMQGEYDNHLKWPFRGEIIIQIYSQPGWRSQSR